MVAGGVDPTAPAGSPQGKTPAAAGASLGEVKEADEMRVEEFSAVLIQARVRGAKVRVELNVGDDTLLALIAKAEVPEAGEARVLAGATTAVLEAVAVAEAAEAELAREGAVSELARKSAGGEDASVEDAALVAEKAASEVATEPGALAQGSAQATAKGAHAGTEAADAVAAVEKVAAEVAGKAAAENAAAESAAAEKAGAKAAAAETAAARESADAAEVSSEQRVDARGQVGQLHCAALAATAETAASVRAAVGTAAAGQAAAAVAEQALAEASQALEEASHAWNEATVASAQAAGAAALAKSFLSLHATFGAETAEEIAALLNQNPPDRDGALRKATEAAEAMAAAEAEATLRTEAEAQDAIATAVEATASEAKATYERVSSRMSSGVSSKMPSGANTSGSVSRTSSSDNVFSNPVSLPPSNESSERSCGVFFTSVALPNAGEEPNKEESARSAARVQAAARGRAERLRLQRAELQRRAAATRVGSSYRGHHARVAVRKEKQAREAGAVRVQAAARGHRSRRASEGAPIALAPDDEGAVLSRMRMRDHARRRAVAASAVQREWRGTRERRQTATPPLFAEQRRLAEERAEAAARVAAGFRGRRARVRVKRVRAEQRLSAALPPLAPRRLANSASLPAISPTHHATGRRLSPPAGRPSPPPLAPDLAPADLLRLALQAHAGRVCGLFAAWDEDGDGEISGADFRKAVPTLLRAWGLPKLAGALGVIDDVFRGLDFHCKGRLSIADLHRRLLALKPDAAELQTEVKQTFTLRTQAPRVALPEELRQPMRNAPPGATLERERAEVNLAKLRTQARGHDAGVDAQVRSASTLSLKARVASSIKTAYAVEVRAGGGHIVMGMSAAEYTLHKAKVDAWASRQRKPGTLDPRVDPLARFFHVPDPVKMAEAAAKRLPSFRPVR